MALLERMLSLKLGGIEKYEMIISTCMQFRGVSVEDIIEDHACLALATCRKPSSICSLCRICGDKCGLVFITFLSFVKRFLELITWS